MVDEQPSKTDTAGAEVNKPTEEDKEINPMLVEARSLAERIEEGNTKSEELLKKQEKLLAEQALSGTAGGNVKAKTPHIETDGEYTQRINKEVAEGKHND